MKTLLLFVSFFCVSSICFAQKQLLAYSDLKFLMENNLSKADSFMTDKGYTLVKANVKKQKHRYVADMPDGSKSAVEICTNGKRNFVAIDTDDMTQFNLIHNTISPFLTEKSSYSDTQIYDVQELGTIRLSVNDTAPANSRLKKDYDIHMVAEKTASNVH